MTSKFHGSTKSNPDPVLNGPNQIKLGILLKLAQINVAHIL